MEQLPRSLRPLRSHVPQRPSQGWRRKMCAAAIGGFGPGGAGGAAAGWVHPEKAKVWIIKDDDLRKRASNLNLIALIRDTMQVLHDAWAKATSRLSQPEKDVVKEEAAKPVKAAIIQNRGLQP